MSENATHDDGETTHFQNESWLSDDPRLPGATDDGYLDRSAFVAAMANVIERARIASPSTAFGLIGPWGIGKSTILEDIRAQLETGPVARWTVRTFNPWMYSDSESLLWGFFSELRDALPGDAKWTDTKKLLGTLRSIAVPVASAIALFGPNANGLVDSVFDQVQPSLTATKSKVEKALKDLPHPILVILDDLDRLTSSELLEVFKLVRFLGRLPNVYYLLSYDERTLKDLIENTELVGREPGRRALDYLEKIVQIRFDIPPLREDLAEREFGRAMGVLLGANSIDRSRNDEARLMNEFSQRLVRRVTTPRALQRFIGQIEAFLPSVKDEVDWVDFCFLSWLRTFEPGLYEAIQRSKTLLLGHSSPFPLENADKGEGRYAAFHELLHRAGVAPHHEPDVIAVLGELFPAVKLIEGKKSMRGLGDVRASRIANPDYFDRYFQFGVPNDDIADSVVREALNAIEKHIAADSIGAVEQHLQSDTVRTIRKIEQLRNHSEQSAAGLARWIASIYGDASDSRVDFWTAADYLENLFSACLADAGPKLALEVFQESQDDPWFARLGADSVSQLVSREIGGSNEVARWKSVGQTLVPEVSEFSAAVFDRYDSSVPVVDIPQRMWAIMYRWIQLDPGATKRYVASRLESGDWDVLDLLTRLVNVATPLGVPDAVGHIEGFDETYVEKFVDLDSVTERLAQELENIPPLQNSFEVPATIENLRLRVLHGLHDRRARLEPSPVEQAD